MLSPRPHLTLSIHTQQSPRYNILQHSHQSPNIPTPQPRKLSYQPQQSPIYTPPRRKNFKQALIHQKQPSLSQQNNSQYSHDITIKSSLFRKNFKQEIAFKKKQQQLLKSNLNNFNCLETSITCQLYKQTPSIIESLPHQQIQIQHKYIPHQPTQPFISTPQHHQSNIQIHQLTDPPLLTPTNRHQLPLSHQLQKQKLQSIKLISAIRLTFKKRSPNKKYQKYNQLPFLTPQTQQSYESYYLDNIRQNFQTLNQQSTPPQPKQDPPQPKQQLPQTHHPITQKSNPQKINELPSQNSHLSKPIKPSSIQKLPTIKPTIKPSSVRSITPQRNSHLSDNSSHKTSLQLSRNRQSIPDTSSQNKSLSSSKAQDTINQLNTLSRFTMNQQQTALITQKLQKQINQNQYGPYQNTLSALLQLIQQFPQAWPIFVVGQKILDQRHQYILKRQSQQKQLSKLNHQIQTLKNTKNIPIKQSKIQQNHSQIFTLIRQLNTLLSKKPSKNL